MPKAHSGFRADPAATAARVVHDDLPGMDARCRLHGRVRRGSIHWSMNPRFKNPVLAMTDMCGLKTDDADLHAWSPVLPGTSAAYDRNA